MAEQAYHNLKPLEPLATATPGPAKQEGMAWSRNSVIMNFARYTARQIVREDGATKVASYRRSRPEISPASPSLISKATRS
jgi:hypothetical protein